MALIRKVRGHEPVIGENTFLAETAVILGDVTIGRDASVFAGVQIRGDDAPVVIGVGPGFTAGEDCHAVVETMRGHTLGRVIYSGSALPNTNIPGLIGGFAGERVLRAPCDGIFTAVHRIGEHPVQPGQQPPGVEPLGQPEAHPQRRQGQGPAHRRGHRFSSQV